MTGADADRERLTGLLTGLRSELPAGIAGVVREILVKNGESVEYGQPLFRISAE